FIEAIKIIFIFGVGGPVLFGIVLFILFCRNSMKRKTLEAELRKEFPDTKLHVSKDDHSFIVVNFATQQIILGMGDTSRTDLPFSSIIQVETLKDGLQTSSTNRGSQVLGAAVGGVALGGVGAIIGGLSGSKTSVSGTKRLSIRITVDDKEKPIHEVLFYLDSTNKGGQLSDIIAQQTAKTMAEFVALLNTAIRESDESKQKSIPQEKQPETMTEQISELWKLKEAGALTKKEFDVQKARLIGEDK
ncbi:MAG: hypothetical protein K8953_08985, partial [Proteobacteria bacterium]|nr:hypothetical protein [Pseudomonadota bacterium]